MNAGMNEPLIFLPGMMCDTRLFGAQIVTLAREMAVMSVPLLGERTEEIASNILDAAPAKFALAGFGFGGAVAMEILRRAPNRVTRVAFISTPSLPDTPAQSAAREPQIIAARTGRFAEMMAQQIMPQMLTAGPDRAAQAELLLAMANDLGSEAFVRQARAMQRGRDHQATLRKITQPALVICGQSDAIYPVKRHEFLAEIIPHASLEVIADAGHLCLLEQPDAVTDALRDWMAAPLVLRSPL